MMQYKILNEKRNSSQTSSTKDRIQKEIITDTNIIERNTKMTYNM
jgi:hypothetical protein